MSIKKDNGRIIITWSHRGKNGSSSCFFTVRTGTVWKCLGGLILLIFMVMLLGKLRKGIK